ncbi:methyltransferase domain-containing protein [Deinococcus aestuarii]|uniref:methyltransferase domain-containing protein n=1 Tax=Deinococcus aestuarii TaxID=2774531 RepID=UPI001C0C7B70|nr:methyltransferase domain-containing protein [Deinococcus aestuarii]
MTQTAPSYVLGSSEQEIARLDGQAASIEAATRLLLRAAGIGPGMRVLDLGTGLGHVAGLVAELVGPGGQVVGLDTSARLLDVARERARDRPQVTFVEGDVRSWRDAEPFDVVVGRLILFHLHDAGAALRHQRTALRPGGLMLVLDFDLGSSRADPPVPLVTQALGWVDAAFRSAGANPTIGTRLAPLLAGAGLVDVQTFGVQGYLAPDDPRGPALLGGVVRAVAPQIMALGLATAEQIGIETLAERIDAATRATGSVVLPPALAGAWGRRAL